MSDHTLDTQPEKRVFSEIADIKRQLLELRTLQLQGPKAIKIVTSSTLTSTISVIGGDTAAFRTVLKSTSGAPIFGIAQMTLYYGSVADANMLGINGTNDRNWACSYRHDCRNAATGQITAFASALNIGSFLGGTIICQSNWLYFIEDGSTTASNTASGDWNGGIVA